MVCVIQYCWKPASRIRIEIPSCSCSQAVKKTVWYFFNVCHPKVCNTYINTRWCISQTQQNLLIEICCPNTILNIIKFCCVWLMHHCIIIKTVWHIPLLCLQWRTPDDGQRKYLKHVEFYSKNKFEKLVHLVGFIIRYLIIFAVGLVILNWLNGYTRYLAHGFL